MALIDNLISYWKLDEASGARYDSHGSNDLTDNNTVVSATGKIGTAADFEATNSEYLSITDNASISTGDIDFTFSCWVYAESLVNYPIILRKGSDVNDNVEYVLYYDTVNNALKFGVSGSASYQEVSSGSALSTGTWYFIVCHHDSVNNQLAISVNNGTLQTVSRTQGVDDGTFPFTIGASVGQSLYWDGLIDEVGFWKRVLTSQERTLLYNQGRGLAYPFTIDLSTCLISHWKLDETSGSRADSIGGLTLADNNTVGSSTGKIGNSAYFIRANSEYLSADSGSAFNLKGGDFAVHAWINPATIDNSTRMNICGKDSDTAVGRQFGLEVNGSANSTTRGSIRIVLFNTDVILSGVDSPADSIAVSSWNHVFAQRNGTTWEIWINGVQQSTSAIPGSSALPMEMQATAFDFRVGGRIYSGFEDYFNGLVDELAIWSRALTRQEITLLYNTNRGLTYPFTIDLTTALISYWKLEEASGTRYDSHGSNHLTDNNTVLSAAGKIGTAADFEATNSEYLSIADNEDLSFGDEDFTFACWVKLESTGSDQRVFWKGDGTDWAVYGLETFGTGWKFRVAGVENYTWNAPSTTTGTWYFIVCWYDSVANTINTQVNNGTIDSTSHSGGITTDAGSFALGTHPVYGGYFDGLIDEFGVWGRVLTSAERTALYNSGSGLTYPFSVSTLMYRTSAMTGGMIVLSGGLV